MEQAGFRFKRFGDVAFAAVPPDVRKGCALTQCGNNMWGLRPFSYQQEKGAAQNGLPLSGRS